MSVDNLSVDNLTTIDTEGDTDTDTEQEGHERANCVNNCPIQLVDQLKKKERRGMVHQLDRSSGLLSIAGMTALWSCPTVVESIQRVRQ